MADALGLPVYAHLQGADGADYALVLAPVSEIEASGAEFTLLHEPDPKVVGKKYLIAAERKEGAYAKALKAIEILHDDGRQVIVWTTPKEAEVLAGLGFEIAWLPGQPMVLTAPKTLMLAPLAGYDPLVAEQLAKDSAFERTIRFVLFTGEEQGLLGSAGYAAKVAADMGQAIAVALKPGFKSSTYTEYWRVWADLNRDGGFDDAGEKLFEKTGAGTVSGTLTIPASAASGITRLRVSMGYDNTPAPCGSFPYGEVEDYSLTIQ
jgi:hypothetical protein